MTINIRKYIFVFVLTCFIFFTAFSISNYINDKKVAQLKTTEDKISIGILSLETQFALLQESSCKKIQGTILSDELDTLGEKLSFTESHNGVDTATFENLKKYYSILQIKDYLLTKKIATKCPNNSASILYFYSTKTACNDCTKEGFVLTHIRQTYPNVRIYSFDYDLDLSAISTLLSLYEIPKKLPVLMINEKVYSGYKSVEDIEALLSPAQKKGNTDKVLESQKTVTK